MCGVAGVGAVEALVNGQVHGQGTELPTQSALMIASLKLADALVKERDRHSQLKEKIRSRSTALLEKLDQKLAQPEAVAH